MLKLLGANIEMVDTPDNQGGYLQSRIKRVQELLRPFPKVIGLTSMLTNLTGRRITMGLALKLFPV